METNPKIFVFQLKELIYTIVFIVLAILLVLLLIFMFLPNNEEEATETLNPYTAGTYSSYVIYNSIPLEVSVKMDKNHINSVDFVPISEDIATISSNAETSLNNISKQVIANQSTLNINSSTESKYTYNVLVDAVECAIAKSTN